MLKFYGDVADETYWDDIWAGLEASTDYGRAEAGHLPLMLRRTFLRWAEPGGRVLEAGCGLGLFTVAARARGFDAAGVDYAPRVIERLVRRFPNIPFTVGDVRRIDATDGAFDAIYSPGVVEHFEDGPEPILRESHRLLRPGGVLILSTPCFNIVLRTIRRLGGLRRTPEGGFFQYAFSERHMAAILHDIGFDVVETRQYGVLLTLTEYFPVIGSVPLGRGADLIAAVLDSLPLVRRAGHTCIWVAKKPTG